MANEIIHKTVGTELTQTEWEATTAHASNSQATDDMIRAQSSTIWERFAVAASRIIGKKATGTTDALTGAETLVVLSGQAGAAFSMNSQRVTSVGTPTTAGDALIKGTRLTASEMLDGTSGQVLTAQGAGGNPVYSAAAVDAKEFFFPAHPGAIEANLYNYGDFGATRIAQAETAYCSFKCPHDYASITNAEFIVITDTGGATEDYDITSDYGAVGEAYNTHSESNTTSTYNITTNQLFAVDISGILSSLAANDYVGVAVKNNEATGILYVLGVRFRYA